MARTPGKTKQAILEAAIRLIEERGPDGFTVDDVLVEADASFSSLYHHFGNRDGLLTAVEEERYRLRVQAEDRRNLDGGLNAQTTDEFLDYVAAQIRRIVTDPANLSVRRGRVQIAARALDSPELAAERRRMQTGMVEAIAAMFDVAQARDLIAADLDTRAYCAWFHGMTLGRTFTEDGTLDTEAWLEIAIPAALAPLRPDRGEAPS